MDKIDSFLGMSEKAFGAVALIFGAITTALGGKDVMLVTLIWFMCADYGTGLITAGVFKASPKSKTGALESRASLKGLFRKGGILLMVFMAVQLDKVTGMEIIRNAVVTGFIASEGISIVENLGLMGLPMPTVITKALDALKQKSEAPINSENKK